jgi:hypothetical protein
VLQEYLNATPGYEDWKLGYATETVRALERWMIDHVELRNKTPEEIEQYSTSIPERFKGHVPVDEKLLTDKTESLAVDMSMYFGEYMRHEDPRLQWVLLEKGKRSVDYQNPVIIGTGLREQNPRWLMRIFAYKISDHSNEPDFLINLKDTWMPELWRERYMTKEETNKWMDDEMEKWRAQTKGK